MNILRRYRHGPPIDVGPVPSQAHLGSRVRGGFGYFKRAVLLVLVSGAPKGPPARRSSDGKMLTEQIASDFNPHLLIAWDEEGYGFGLQHNSTSACLSCLSEMGGAEGGRVMVRPGSRLLLPSGWLAGRPVARAWSSSVALLASGSRPSRLLLGGGKYKRAGVGMASVGDAVSQASGI